MFREMLNGRLAPERRARKANFFPDRRQASVLPSYNGRMEQGEWMPGKMAEEKVRINRILMIDEAIRSGVFPTIAKLARKAEVTNRTIERDIEYLRDIYQAPIEYNYEKRGYYYSEPNFFIKSVILTEGELFSIALFDRLLEQYRNTPLEAALRRIFNKIIQSMPDRVTVDSGLLGPQISVISDHQGFIDPEVFEDVFTALKTKRTVTFDYRPLQKTTYMKRTVDPYHAICQRGNWYFIGHCHDKNEPRMFSFSRVKNANLTEQHFTIPADFQPEAFFDKEMGVWASSHTPYTVELLINNEIGTYALERQWHDTQTVEQREDGSVYVSFTTTQIPEALRWVLGQGHTVKALAPSELVEQIKAETEKVRGIYE
jgi:predicted DNA-binding transcriptional regulator YafY